MLLDSNVCKVEQLVTNLATAKLLMHNLTCIGKNHCLREKVWFTAGEFKVPV